MVSRVETPSDTSYKHYGARGIAIDPSLRHFTDFLTYMGRCPNEYSLERIDNNGNYEKGNLKWATASEQARNRRTNHFITIDGVTKTLTYWSEVSGLKRQTIETRLRLGWGHNSALLDPNVKMFTPKERARKRKTCRILTINGISKIVVEWAEFAEISPKTLRSRLSAGWPINETLLQAVTPN